MNKFISWLSGILFGVGSTSLESLGVNEITSIDQLEAALRESDAQPVLIFKHSTTCPISASAYHRVATYLREAGEAAPKTFLVKVIESRPVSNEIAARLGVTHQSPQAILVRAQRAVWHASHHAIEAGAIQRALQAA